jgi:hypothetical protein
MIVFKKLTTAEDFLKLKGTEILLIKWKPDYFWQHGLCVYAHWNFERPDKNSRSGTLNISKHVYLLPGLYERGKSNAEEIYSVEDVEPPL